MFLAAASHTELNSTRKAVRMWLEKENIKVV